MELGEKLRQARQEAGLSQRQLCGEVITRNMLSQIEHGTARPSMDTLRYLASRLGKPISWFLEEEAVLSPNQDLMTRAKAKWAENDQDSVWLMLKDFKLPDPALEWEWKYLSFLSAMAVIEKAVKEGRHLYARQLLDEAEQFENGVPGLKRQRLLLFGKIQGTDLKAVVNQLPSLDEELLLRAEAALMEKKGARALRLLDAMENQTDPNWHFHRGKAYLLLKQYDQAVLCLKEAEKAFPETCWPLLEESFRELGDFQQAYVYACKQRK